MEIYMLDRNTWNYLTVYKSMNTSSFKNVSTKWVYKYIFDKLVKKGFGIK